MWAFRGDRISVRFQYGNELWELDEHGLMRRREASIDDLRIDDGARRFHWPSGPRPADHPGLSALGM